MSHRDPRFDPLPGDVLRWNERVVSGEGIEREVIDARHNRVKVKTTFLRSMAVVYYHFSLDDWRRITATAEVVHRAPEVKP